MADTDSSLYNLRYNQVTQGIEGFGGGTPQWTPLISSAGTPTPPAGSDTQIQYNNAGAFGASPNLTYDGTTVSILSGINLYVDGNATLDDGGVLTIHGEGSDSLVITSGNINLDTGSIETLSGNIEAAAGEVFGGTLRPSSQMKATILTLTPPVGTIAYATDGGGDSMGALMLYTASGWHTITAV